MRSLVEEPVIQPHESHPPVVDIDRYKKPAIRIDIGYPAEKRDIIHMGGINNIFAQYLHNISITIISFAVTVAYLRDMVGE
jgi:hypothetical protein